MAIRVADPGFFPILSAISIDAEKPAENGLTTPVFNDRLGALRGLGFAVVFEILFAVIGIGAWEILRRLF